MLNLPFSNKKPTAFILYFLFSFFAFYPTLFASSTGACIAGLTTNTPSCNGINVSFDVSFTAVGTFQVMYGGVVVAAGTTSPIKVTIPTPNVAGNKTITVRFVGNCDEDIIVNLPRCETIIPAFSQWGLLVFGLLILNIGLILVRKLFQKN